MLIVVTFLIISEIDLAYEKPNSNWSNNCSNWQQVIQFATWQSRIKTQTNLWTTLLKGLIEWDVDNIKLRFVNQLHKTKMCVCVCACYSMMIAFIISLRLHLIFCVDKVWIPNFLFGNKRL